jgi:hypothetical protein
MKMFSKHLLYIGTVRLFGTLELYTQWRNKKAEKNQEHWQQEELN